MEKGGNLGGKRERGTGRAEEEGQWEIPPLDSRPADSVLFARFRSRPSYFSLFKYFDLILKNIIIICR